MMSGQSKKMDFNVLMKNTQSLLNRKNRKSSEPIEYQKEQQLLKSAKVISHPVPGPKMSYNKSAVSTKYGKT